MRRESFNYLRTMREIKTGLDLAREPQRIQTTSGRFRASFEKELEPHINEKAIAVSLRKSSGSSSGKIRPWRARARS